MNVIVKTSKVNGTVLIKNNGKDDFIFDSGSDYRGATRHLRFYFTATNEKGSKAIDPKPNQNWMGGLGGPISLKPGEDYETELPLLAYLKFPEPGNYTIKGYQALGFGEPDKTIPNGSEYGMEWEYAYGNRFNITIRKPDSEDIENFIQTQLLIKDAPEKQRRFSYVYDPSYLQPLLRTLKSESDEERIKALITGIGSILTVESTQQLIALSQDDRMAVRTNALQQLFMRMPSKPNSNLSVERLKPFWRKYEIEQAWEESLRSQITKAGIIQKCLKSQSLAEVNAIARIVSLQGDPNMMPLLAQAADRIAPDIPASRENAQTINNLAGAAYSLYDYGYVPIKVDKHSSPGRLVIWANSVLRNKELHTEQWEDLLLLMMSLDCNLTQYHAIRWLPEDFKQTDHIPWEKLMSAEDHQVWWYTIQSTRKVKPSKIREIATKVLNETDDKEKQRNIKELLEEISQTE